ncbi:MAG: cbb3-type cytochrome oxidase assembly protein CcoS [Planctomycetota bacterium]
MTVLFVVLPLALLIAAAALWGFGWAVKRGQFDDLETPGRRMLLDDDPVVDPSEPAEEEPPRS